jgi:GTPase
MTDIAYRETTTAIAVAGSADSGKSSFIGVIISGKLDNGNGSARLLVAKHDHEIKRGKTSDISTRVLDIPDKNQALTIIDLCGQADYFKTTTFGLSGYFPDYSFLIVSANRGVLPMTVQHIRILVSLSIPILIVITHVDITPPDVYKSTVDSVKRLVSNMCGKMSKIEFMNDPFDKDLVTSKSEEEILSLKKEIKDKTIAKITEENGKQIYYPVISISNKTGYFIDVMTEIMKELPVRELWVTVDEKYIANNKIIKFFKQNITQRVYENFTKIFIKSILDIAEIQNVLKEVIIKQLELGEKKKESHTDPTNQTFMGKIMSKLVPTWFTGKISDDQIIQNLISDVCGNFGVILTEMQVKFITDSTKTLAAFLQPILVIDNSQDTNTNIICAEIQKFLTEQILKKVTMEFPVKNIMTDSYSHIVNSLAKKNQLETVIQQIYTLFSNKDFCDNIRKIDDKQNGEIPELKEIIDRTCIQDLFKNQDFEKSLFQEYQKIEGSVYYIDNCYNPPGIGLVITGINRGDEIKSGDKMYIGPIGKDFAEFKVKSMHNNNREIIEKLGDHGRGTIAMALAKKGDIRRNHIRKGMITMSNLNMNRYICYRFKAAITIFAKSVTVRTGYSPVIHLGTIRQPARIILDPEENGGQDNIGFNAKSTNIAIVTFKFKCYPEFVEPYSVFLFRSGDIHGLGVVLSSLPISQDADAKPDDQKTKNNVRHQ